MANPTPALPGVGRGIPSPVAAQQEQQEDSLPSLEFTSPQAGATNYPQQPNQQWGHGLIDTRAYGKLKNFSGKEEDWSTWSFVARSYFDLLSMGYRDLLMHAEAVSSAAEIKMQDMTPVARTHAWTLFNVLTQSIENRALSIIMNAETSNGLQAWRLLVDAYEPKIGGRYTAMLMGILSPTWSHVHEKDFLETLDVWEVQVRRYEDQSKEKVTSATRCAIIMRNAPGGIRTALRTSSSVIGSDYQLLKKAVKDYLQSGVDFDAKGLASDSKASDPNGPAPMEVGALSWKGGKKGKSEKGKKGKDKGKEKGVKGKSKSGSSRFQGYCSYCWKWGHRKAECRNREKDKKDKGKGGSTNAVDKNDKKDNQSANAVQYERLGTPMDWDPDEMIHHRDATGMWPDTRATSSSQVEYASSSVRRVPVQHWADVKDDEDNFPGRQKTWEEEVDYGTDEEEEEDKRWVSAVTREVGSLAEDGNKIHEKFIMFDSGSDEHVCKVEFGGKGQEQASTVKLNAVSGDALSILGERKVVLVLAGMEKPVEIEVIFQVSKNAQKNILSSGKLFRKGFSTVMNPKGQSYLTHEKAPDHIPLFMYGNSFYLRLLEVRTVPMVSHRPRAIVAPVSGDVEDWENAGGEDAEEGGELIPEGEVSDRHITSRMTLTQDSTVKEMRERLKHLGYTVHGSKPQLWSRLKRAEKEEYKRIEKRRKEEAEIRLRNEDLVQPGSQVKAPSAPSEEERARHNLTHLPTADWCEHCVKGKGREMAHRITRSDRAVVQIDYSYLKADGSYEETTEDPANVVVTIVDRGTGLYSAFSVPAKNFEKEYLVKSMKAFVSQLGHIKVTIRSDGEPSILQLNHELRDELNKMRGKEVESKADSEQAPRYSAQSMGAVGAAQRTLKGDFLTLRSEIEAKLKAKINPAMNVWPWMVRHAAWVRGRFGVKANMRTAYEDAYGGQYTGQILPFGEVLLFKVPHSSSGRKTGGRQLKGDPVWERGVFLGKVNETDEFLVGNAKGVHSARTVRRLEERMRWDPEAIMAVRGVPWNRETTIGRPRRTLADGVQPAPATPKPEAGLTGSETLPSARGQGTKRDEEIVEEKKEGKAKKAKTTVTDSSARLEPMDVSNPQAAGSGMNDEERKRRTEEDRAAVEESVKRWKKQKEQVEARHEGGPPKKLKIGDQMIGALFTAIEDEEKFEDHGMDHEEVEIDEDLEKYGGCEEDEEAWKNVPITDEERLEGKKKELEKMSRFKTFKVIPKEQAKGLVLDSTWVEARKPDGSVRMRYCLREFKSSSYRDDVYAVSTTSATGRLIDLVGVTKKYVFFTGDATNAFWQVPIDEECYMYPPEEWLEEERKAGRPTDVMWMLQTEWYGRRVAGTKWVEWAAGKVMKAGCQRSKLAPWLFHHPTLDISLELHMDDIYGCGPPKAVKKFLEELHKEIEMKSEIHMPGGEPYYHLKRKRIYGRDGSLFIQSDAKHLNSIKKLLHLQGAKGAVTPAVAGGSNYAHGEEKLKDEDCKKFKTAVGTLMYVAPDRPDCQFAIRELTKSLKEPKVMDMQALIRLSRYLIQTEGLGIKFDAEEHPSFLECYSDTDWGNCKRTRKSTACGVFKVGNCTLASYCRGLSMICLSSGEAEFNGGVSACSEGLFYHQLLGFMGISTQMRVHLDSSAARGVFQRQGAGRIRHLEIKSLWVQVALRQKKFTLHSVGTNDNVADVGTKALPVAKLEKFRSELNIISEEEFRATGFRETHTGGSVVGAVNKLQTMIQVFTALGLVQPVKAAKSQDEESSWWTWMLMFCVVWTIVTMVVATMMVMKTMVKAMAKDQEVHSCYVHNGRFKTFPVRGASGKGSKSFGSIGMDPVDVSDMSVDSEGEVKPSRKGYSHEKASGSGKGSVAKSGGSREFSGESGGWPPIYITEKGEVAHYEPDCRGLQKRQTRLKKYEICKVCRGDSTKKRA